MATVIVHKAGLLTMVQDRGRFGYQRYGMPVSGAMDVFSLELANLLVGNDPGDACLEATISGPELEFTGSTWIAITGAVWDPHLNGQGIPMNTAVDVRPGDRLGFRGLRSGCRTYIAFAGGIAVPSVMDSQSTYLRAGIGGFQGRGLIQGDELPLGTYNALLPGNELPPGEATDLLPSDGLTLGKAKRKPRRTKIPEGLIPEYKHEQTIRVISGPEVHYFELAGLRSFLSTEYTVTTKSDRMGYRLSGEPIKHKEGMTNIISAGISLGTVQVPGDGQPIILMADRQTSGGYARIANVITADFTLLAQMRPGDEIRFTETTLDRARLFCTDRHRVIFGI
ncbi:MAG: biotin-dependent carboxyltransferase family protein [Bacteroidales bacterium]|nr:biotin-dependent carboxyltransferase family protein [Bacteroidales bacterium]MDT8372355.1 biotin-dependent carboxyltransferase family protein [Bacteroidales bacterium]